MTGRSSIAVVVAVLAVIGVVLAVVRLWGMVGGAEISAAGWVAMGFGVILTLALGIGLMALVFISSRQGYDDPGRHEP
jgi:hypothetical protein